MIHKYSDNPIFSKKKKQNLYFISSMNCKQFGDLILEVLSEYSIKYCIFYFISYKLSFIVKLKKKKTEEKEIPEKLRSIMWKIKYWGKNCFETISQWERPSSNLTSTKPGLSKAWLMKKCLKEPYSTEIPRN